MVDADLMTRLLTSVLLVLVLTAAAACGGADDDPRIGFEAQWQCDVQRRTFDDLRDIEQARSEALDQWGISHDAYQAFRVELAESQDLRTAVEAEYDEYCTD